MPQPIDELLDSREAVVLDGVGESIEAELQALRTTGESPRHQELLARTGPGVFDLLEIQGLGMRRLQTLFQEADVASIPALKKAAENGQLRNLRGFGTAVEEKLLTEIEHWEHTRGRRFPLPEAKGLADSIRYQLLQLPEVDRAEVGGSIRRGRETIGDIDILVTTNSAATVSRYFKTLPEVTEVIADGDTRASVRVIGGIQVDLRVLEPHLFGAGLHYFTGSKEHHIKMRLRSKKIGLKISEKGVYRYDDPTETPVGPMNTEEDVFAAVGLPYIAPEIRTGTTEVELAESGELPSLVEPTDIRGDIRCCTDRSSGRADLETMVRAAEDRGYEWLVVTERSRGVDDRRGLDDDGVRAWLDTAAQLDAICTVRVIAGVEVEITPQGMFDIDHRVLARADWILAGLHHGAAPDPDENTQRIIWGIETGLVSCLTAPTGRRIGGDDRYSIYFDEVVEACIDFGCALEMSGQPSLLDLNAQLGARARERGASIALGSGATSASSLDNLDYALQQARRAWFTADDVLNTFSAEQLLSSVRALH